MSTTTLADFAVTEQQRQVVEAVEHHGSARKAAKALGMDRANVSRSYRRVKALAAKRGWAPEYGHTDVAAEGFQVKGHSTLVDKRTGETVLEWIKTSQDGEQQLAAMREMAEALAAPLPRAKRIKPPARVDERLMTVYPLGDPHFGMQSWAAETGADFDLDIARRDLCAAVRYLVQQSPRSQRGVLINLGDFFHADNFEGTTAGHGHILDMDTRMPKMLHEGILALRACLDEMLKKHETVEMINVPGNHDPILGHVLSVFFSHMMERNERLVIHDAPTWRHYVEHGTVALGAAHGDKTPDNKLMGIMAAERAEMWGRTKHRVFFRGHHHHDSRVEYTGGVVEQVRTLAAQDAYASSHGFLSGRDMKAITYDREYGEIARFTCGIDLLRDQS